jgi:hypothetical protein
MRKQELGEEETEKRDKGKTWEWKAGTVGRERRNSEIEKRGHKGRVKQGQRPGESKNKGSQLQGKGVTCKEKQERGGGACSRDGESKNECREGRNMEGETRLREWGMQKAETEGRRDANLAGTSWLTKSPSPAPSTLDSATYTIRAS